MAKNSLLRFIYHLHPQRIPVQSAVTSYTWCLGGLTFLCFIIEAVTGALLMLFYIPTRDGAYSSVQAISHVVPYGFLVRNIHYWVGQGMVIFTGLHMIRVYVSSAYAPPRRLNWIIGVALLVLTLFIDFTGYLLVWDSRSFWAWTIARNLAEHVPLMGSFMAAILFGGPDPSDYVLVRIYTWHVFLLPQIILILAALHFWKVRKDGISVPL